MLPTALKCYELLKKQKLSAEVVSFHTIKPLDKIFLKKKFNEKKLIVTIEEHGMAGGAGSAILEFANKKNINYKKILNIAGPDKFLTGYGSQFDARRKIGLYPQKIVKKILNHFK